jgi:hypothetical protein
MRRSGKAKPWYGAGRNRFMKEGVGGLLRDKTRKPGKPLPAATVEKVIGLVIGRRLTSASWLNAVEGFFAKLTTDGSNVASLDQSPKSRSPSSASSPRQMPIPTRSCGPHAQAPSWPLSNEGSKR